MRFASSSRSSNGTCSTPGSIGTERPAERGLRRRRRAPRTLLPWKPLVAHDDRRLGGIVRARELERAFDRLGSAVAEERVLQIARRDHRQRLGQHRAQRIEQILLVQRLAARAASRTALTTFGWRWPTLKMPNPPETVDVFAAADIAERVATGVGPLDGGVGRAARGGLSIFEKAGIHVIPEGRRSSRSTTHAASASDRARGPPITSKTRCVYGTDFLALILTPCASMR